MASTNRNVGDLGEDRACEYLISEGHKIVDRNYATKFGEIDIITKRAGVIFFVEVKAGKGNSWVQPEELITQQKLRRLLKTVEMYFLNNKIKENQEWQLDGISLLLDSRGKVIKLKHLENINIR